MSIWLPIVILAMIFNSWLQMKNVILILIFKFQDFSMVYWGFDLNNVYYLHFCFKDFKLSWEYNSQSDFTWECLWLTSLHSLTCGSVFEYQDTLPTHIFSHAPTFVVNSKLMLWQFGRPFCYHCGPFPSCVAIFVNLFQPFLLHGKHNPLITCDVNHTKC